MRNIPGRCFYHASFFNAPINPQQQRKVALVEQQLRIYSGNPSFILEFVPTPDTAFSRKDLNRITLSREFLTHNISIDEIAGVMAHECGHLCDTIRACNCHHVRSKMEFNADEFAAAFLATHGYSVEPLIHYCTKRPEIPNDVHGRHLDRSLHLRASYQANVSFLAMAQQTTPVAVMTSA